MKMRAISRPQSPIQDAKHKIPGRNNFNIILVLAVALFVVLGQSGCVGLTSANGTSSTGSASDSTGMISVSPATISFGNVPVGSTSKQNFTITNAGTTSVTISQAAVSGTGFSITSTSLPLTLSSGQSTTFAANFTPASAGSASGSVAIVGDQSTAPATIVASGVGVDGGAPVITQQPTNQTIVAGQTATFSVAASGTAPFNYQWQRNGTLISGATSSSYTTPAQTTANSGDRYFVVVNNAAGHTDSNTATLTVNSGSAAPSITTQPVSQTITAGQTATFSVAASGTAPFNYQWQRNGTLISGATSSSYTTPVQTTANSGDRYFVVVNNAAGHTDSNIATLTVNSGSVAPSITTQPVSQTITAGQTATFSVAASGTTPLTYQWKKNGIIISGATAASYTTPAETTADNGAQFTVTITNLVSAVNSNIATLTVNSGSVAPSITTQPVSRTITAGQTATFSVAASGTAPLTYQWKKNGTVISGATAASYTTPAETTADNGAQFTVTVTNSVSAVNSNIATLTVTAVSTFSFTPTPTSFSFSAVANGSTPASQALTISDDDPTNSHPFTVSASQPWLTFSPSSGNTTGTVTVGVNITGLAAGTYNGNIILASTSLANSPYAVPVTLTVSSSTTSLSSSTSTLNFGSITVGSNNAQSVTLTNSGNATVTISNVSVSGPGFNASGVSSGLILSAGQTATLNVTFAPATATTVAGSATITSNAPLITISLSGTGVAPSPHSVTLGWGASSSSVTGYYVYRSTVSGSSYTALNTTPVSATQFTDSTVQAAHTYYYVVTSVNSSNSQSTYSNQVTANIP